LYLREFVVVVLDLDSHLVDAVWSAAESRPTHDAAFVIGDEVASVNFDNLVVAQFGQKLADGR
jgi:hypothetical protein